MFILDPFDRTVNKGNTVLRGRETALFDKMLETLKELSESGRLIKEVKKQTDKHIHKMDMLNQTKEIKTLCKTVHG